MAKRKQKNEPEPSLEHILACQSVDELRSVAKLAPIRSVLQEALDARYSFRLKLNFRNSWRNLYAALGDVRPLIQGAGTNDSSYFVSEPARVIHALLELDGENRIRALGISDREYRDKDAAKRWYKSLAQRIHPDICQHPLAEEASAKLRSIYEEVVGDW